MSKSLPFFFSFIFSICLHAQKPANDDCSKAVSLPAGSACVTTAGTLYSATAINPMGSCGNMYDVWYKFTMPATATFATISVRLTSVPSSLTTANTFVELFNAGNCGSLDNNSLGCSSIVSPLTSGLLTSGGTYYFRVYTNTNPNMGSSAWNYDVCVATSDNVDGEGSRMREVFKQKILSPPKGLGDPWEIIYGPDGYLWLTEAKGYKVDRMDPNTGAKTTILKLSPGASGYLSSTEHNTFNREDWSAQTSKWPQGGLAGMVLHPQFMADSNPKNFVYLSYVHDFDRTDAGNAGSFFINWIVRFTYNPATNKLENPIKIIDTLPGSSDHNSQRMIIAPVNGKYYLFYAQGDMGAGQFDNAQRPNNAQLTSSYEGKILRFNLEPDTLESTYDQWIPNDNPFNTASPAKQSAVWATGIRNNQGFAFADINGNGYLYGSSHGPFSDDEINIIEPAKNYGHPRVIGYRADGNYNNAKAGESGSSLPLIYDEDKYAKDTIGLATYRDPIYSFYPAEKGNTTIPSSIQFIYTNQTYTAPWATGSALQKNQNWYSEGICGMELYANSMIPGWKNSLLMGTLKGGKVERMKLTADGKNIVEAGTSVEKSDTLGYFRSRNRFRDVAIAPDGKTIFTIVDSSQTTSGPTQTNPIQSLCAGCVQKYTFLGYAVDNNNGNRSTIRDFIPITTGKANAFETVNKVVINAANGNTNLWVPITDSNSNIVAEIYAQGHDLDTITTTLFTKTGGSRIKNGMKYLNRNLTISPQKQPGGTIKIRLYISKAEYDQLKNDGGIDSINHLNIIKNKDSATSAIGLATTLVTTTIAEAFGTDGYVLQGDISGFSSFYFSSGFIPLPLQLLSFKGALQNNSTLLKWETVHEINTAHFVVERSKDGIHFDEIGKVIAAGNSDNKNKYEYVDGSIMAQASPVLYYRLKMVDADGRFSYSIIVMIELQSAYTVTLFPNPMQNQLKIKLLFSKTENIQIQITDVNGRMVYKAKKFVGIGNNEWQIDTKNWKPQLYTVTITGVNNKIIQIQNVIKL